MMKNLAKMVIGNMLAAAAAVFGLGLGASLWEGKLGDKVRSICGKKDEDAQK